MQRQQLVTVALLSAAFVLLIVIPPSFFERLPSVCLHQWLLRLAGLRGAAYCPGCGSVRALSHLFHGQIAQAVRYNVNCLLIAPLIIGLIAVNFGRWLRSRITSQSRITALRAGDLPGRIVEPDCESSRIM